MRGTWVSCLGLSMGLLAGTTHADDSVWKASRRESTGAAKSWAALGAPVAALGRPEPMKDGALSRAAYESKSVVRAQMPDPLTSPVAPPPPPHTGGFEGVPFVPDERYNCGVVMEPPGSQQGFWSRCWDHCRNVEFGEFHATGRSWFQSDHCFDQFISPVTNPFLFEDPRALTELRPIFIYQYSPKSNWIWNGGNNYFFGTQARIAFTDRLSVSLTKMGGIWTDIKNPQPGFDSANGFAEVWIGPKYTLIRNENSGTLAAVGWNFQIPAGPARVFQDTGNLGMEPYITVGQNFWRTSYGSMNFLYNIGYVFGSNNARTDFLNNSLHLSYDVLNAHRFYPLVELTWVNYTQAGTARNIGFEGRDLYNFGSQGVSGNNNVVIAPGFRYKFAEWAQMGTAVELPLNGRRDLLETRVTVDFILRY